MDKFYILLLLIPVANGQIFNVCEGKDCLGLECRKKKGTGCPTDKENCHECFDPCGKDEITCKDDQICVPTTVDCKRGPCPKKGLCKAPICPKGELPHKVIRNCRTVRGKKWCFPGYTCHTNSDDISTCCHDPCEGQCGHDEYCDKEVLCSQGPWNLGPLCRYFCRAKKCSEPLQLGTCNGSIPRFYFDSTTGMCKPFTYGGCGGNGNNYGKIEDCIKQCRASPLSICYLPPVTGPICDDYTSGYYYNPESRRCDPFLSPGFLYGGCDDTANNFDSLHQCWMMCEKPLSLLRREAKL